MFTFGSIGMGNMGLCILDGALKCGAAKPSEIIIFDPDPARQNCARERGFTVAETEEEAYAQSRFLLFAIIPQLYENVLKKLRVSASPDGQTVLSIAPGISSAFIQSYLGENKKVIRIMPNTPLTIGKGATAISKTAQVSEEEFAKVRDIFGAMGSVAVIPETLMTEVIPANGSAPAYVYYFIDSLARAVEKHGVAKDLALNLVVQSVIGSAHMLLQSGLSPQELIDQVCSPGGVTIESIKVFDKCGLSAIISEGCDACISRGYELAR